MKFHTKIQIEPQSIIMSTFYGNDYNVLRKLTVVYSDGNVDNRLTKASYVSGLKQRIQT